MTRIRIDCSAKDADTIQDILALFVEYIHLDDKQKTVYAELAKAVEDCRNRHKDYEKTIIKYYKQ
jgi:hypothetical protein